MLTYSATRLRGGVETREKNSFVSFYSILCIIYNLLSSAVAKDLSGDNSRPSPTLVLATTPKLYTVKGAAE